jgi:UPF0716 protein FxsA
MNIFRLVKVFLYLLPLLEIAGFIIVGGWIGVLPTLLLIIITAILGLFILRIQGFVTLMHVQRRVQRGEHPATEVLSGALLMLGGLLLVIPGFITDIAGLLLLIPVVRILVLRWLEAAGILLPGPRTKPSRRRHGRTIEGEWRRENNKRD